MDDSNLYRENRPRLEWMLHYLRSNAMKQTLGVSYMQVNNAEKIRYAPAELPDGRRPAYYDLSIRREIITRHLDGLRDLVRQIVNCALQGTGRGELSVEDRVSELGKHVLPPEGFTRLLPPEVDPSFECDELLASIPWEMFAEVFFQCRNNPAHVQLEAQRSPAVEEAYCPRCAGPMMRQESKLGISRAVSHVVRPSEPAVKPDGSTFLMILDPLNDLCSAENDPEGICRESIRELQGLLSRYFTVTMLPGAQAKPDDVLRHIGRQDLVGIYYFGHGRASDEGGEGTLILDRDSPLFARDIRTAAPSAPLIFVNACGSADIGGKWSLEKKFESAAHAFAQGPAKTVIGCQWPVVSTQAAVYALEFFTAVLEGRQTAGEALSTIRRHSLERYQKGEPDTGWMSYRLFGDCDQRLVPDTGAATVTTETCPLFDGDGCLDPDAFAFPIESILLRAVKRRNIQERDLVSLEDLVAGMLRKGDLMRMACSTARCDPDQLYQRLCETEVEPEDVQPDPKEQPRSEPEEEEPLAQPIEGLADSSRWAVHRRKEYEPRLINLLNAACSRARTGELQGPLEQQVTQRDLIEVCMEQRADGWHWLDRLEPHLPEAVEIRAFLDRTVGKEVDENGCLVFDDLDDDARQVVEAAHVLSQQRGTKPIPTRLLLAAFLSDETRLAWQACENLGLPPDDLRFLMIAITEGKTPGTFALSHAVCGHVVSPVVKRARRLARAEGKESVDEASLFRCFAQVVRRGFKKFLKHPPLQVDLDAIAAEVQKLSEDTKPSPASGVAMGDIGDTSGSSVSAPRPGPRRPSRRRRRSSSDRVSSLNFDEASWKLLREAEQISADQGAIAIFSPHLFAAMIGDGTTPVAESLRSQQVDPRHLKQLVLELVPLDQHPGGKSSSLSLTEHVGEIMKQAVQVARDSGRQKASPADLAEAFFADGGGAVGDLLARNELKPPLPAAGQTAIPLDENVRFTVYSPEALVPEKWYPMLAFAHLADRPDDADPQTPDPVEEVKRQAEELLGNRLDDYLTDTLSSCEAVPRQGLITFVPEVPGIVFNPPKKSFLWRESVHWQDFRLQASANLDGRSVCGCLTVYLGSLILVDIPLRFRVDHRVAWKPEIPPVERGNVSPYRKIFPSYSHRDIAVVEELERYASALGDEYLRDQTSLRAGEEWSPRLEEMIREADVFQLFWSSNSMNSQHVQHEWRYALSLNRPYFVRPTYWEEPFPVCPSRNLPPPELLALHFQRLTLDAGCLTPDVTQREESKSGGPAVVAADQVDGASASPLRHVAVDPAALAGLDDRINRRISGQQAAARAIAEAIQQAYHAARHEHRPWCRLLCLGPPGVGKAAMVNVLAEELFGTSDSLISVDMRQFAHPGAPEQLLAAQVQGPDGARGTTLIQHLSAHPACLVLLDRVELAHENTLQSAAAFLSSGLTEDEDENGIHVSNSIFVLTMNTDPSRGIVHDDAQHSWLKQRLPVRLFESLDAIVRLA